MVDDTEFIKRRHLSRGRPRKYELGSVTPTMESATAPSDTISHHLDTSSTSGQNGFGQAATLSEVQPPLHRQHKKSARGSKRKSSSSRQQQSEPFDLAFKQQQHLHCQQQQQHQQQHQQHTKQQPQRCLGDSFLANSMRSEHLVLPPFNLGSLSNAPSIHSYSMHPHNPNERYLNPNPGGVEFDLGMTFYHGNGTIDG